MKRGLASLLVSGILLFGAIPAASAHARVVATSPKSGATISTWPSMYSITFNEPILKIAGAVVDWIYVKDQKGIRFDLSNPVVAGGTLTVGLKRSAKSGLYAVNYRAVSDDGHPVTGKFTFTLRLQKVGER